ncbi:Eukaryotic translation initiation factor 5 [Apostasia shenzhenica]|uniref:Eukaryotic translation initiation factor 5 n=1 Tax=Apostasia shenzhenica TaxID=1088818 RepID=A0A2I0B3D2_9ASPA|nr:Eukaryotic translation initiation factor 5 [Apostasia shenzhenica]
MAFQNIGAANSDDAFYRYKMPRMITKIEGRGNGIKTNVVNMVDIAKALARPPSYTTKYFGCELGAQSKFDEKTGISLVNGAHDTAKLAGLLEIFIKKYVQCYGCGNPETEIIITKTQMITMKCAACGFTSDVDMRDKLTTFILKNPPEQKKKDKKGMRKAEKERLKEGEVVDEEQKKLKKDAKKKSTKDAVNSKPTAKKKTASSDEERNSPNESQVDDNEIPEEDDDHIQWQTDTSVEAAHQRIQEQLNSVTAEMVMLSTNAEEKPKQEKKPKSPKVNGTVAEAKKVSIHDTLVTQIKDKVETAFKPIALATFARSLPGSTQEIIDALFEALFDGMGKGFAKEVAKKKNYLAAVLQEEGAQMFLLHAVEAFCNKCNGDVMKEVALAVKALYDGDVLEEEFVVQWYEEGIAGATKKAQIWKNMKPFIEWLQSAESESEEE